VIMRTLREKAPTRDKECAVLLLFFLVLLCAGIASAEPAATVGGRFPGLVEGPLASAKLAPLDDDTVLEADGIRIGKGELLERIQGEQGKMREQLEKNLLFVLDQEITRRLLLNEAKKAGISTSDGADGEVIQALFDRKFREVSATDRETRDFYKKNKELMGGLPFEQVKEGIREYLVQDKRQQAVARFVSSLGNNATLSVNKGWVETHAGLAMENPVDRARTSGRPTMVEFGAAGCVPCDMMQPILEKLRKDYPDRLNVVFVHVQEEQILAARYGIRSIPVQVFFDGRGEEVFRHVGFFAEKEVKKQLARMGIGP